MPFRWALRTGKVAMRPQWEKGTISTGVHEPVGANYGRARAVLWLWLVWFFDLAMVAALRAHLQYHRACNPARQAAGVSSFVSIVSSALFVVNAPGLPAMWKPQQEGRRVRPHKRDLLSQARQVLTHLLFLVVGFRIAWPGPRAGRPHACAPACIALLILPPALHRASPPSIAAILAHPVRAACPSHPHPQATLSIPSRPNRDGVVQGWRWARRTHQRRRRQKRWK